MPVEVLQEERRGDDPPDWRAAPAPELADEGACQRRQSGDGYWMKIVPSAASCDRREDDSIPADIIRGDDAGDDPPARRGTDSSV